MTRNFSVSVIIPNYNGEELLEKNIPFVLAAFKYKKNNIKEIIVVDDGSVDQSLSLMKRHFPKIRLIKHTVNRGFSAAVNTGARMARGKLLCLLNTDVIPNENFLEYAIGHFKDGKVFGVSLHEKGYGPSVGRFIDGFIVHDPGIPRKKIQETFWISGGSGVFRRSVWMELRGMNEKIFSPFYWEDVDICYRALKRGYKLLWEPKSKVTHEHEATVKKSKFSIKKRQLINERNQLLFIWKNLTSKNLFRKHVRGLLTRIRKHPGYIRIVILALLKIKAVIEARKREIKESTVSDEAIFTKF